MRRIYQDNIIASTHAFFYKDCRNSTNDLTYSGSIHTTRYGNTCRSWNTAAPYYRRETANYCRTPLHDPDNGGGPWCYIDERRWERCNIPVCEGTIYCDAFFLLICPHSFNYII